MDNLKIISSEVGDIMSATRESDDSTIIADKVCRWGSSSSVVLLDPSCKVFRVPHIDGIIGYRHDFGCAVVFGEPLCSNEDKPYLVHAFQNYCKDNFRNVIYTAVSGEFAKWAMKDFGSALMEVGKELVIDPHCNPAVGGKARALRNKLSFSKRQGVVVQEYLLDDEKLEKAIEEAGASWLAARSGPQIYLANVFLFKDPAGKRWFYARHNDKIVGVLLLNKLEAHQGWVLNLLMATPEAPNGTSELLVMSVIEALRKEDCSYLSCGVTPAAEIGEMLGFSPLSVWVARTAFKTIKKIFHLDGRRKYLQKFQPAGEPSYLLFSSSRIGPREILSVMRALNVTL